MEYRDLGRTGARVSEVGLGCNRLGEMTSPDEHWAGIVRRALELGVSLFDTAEQYAGGRSEEVLGRTLGDDDSAIVATKMSRSRPGRDEGFGPEPMRRAAEESLRRLRRERIDIYQLHSPSREALESGDWVEGMERLRDEGKIRWRAVAANSEEDAVWLIEQGLVEVLQITYNLFSTDAERRLFALAEERGTGLMVRLPLGRGVLTGKFRAGEPVPEGHRALLDGAKLERRIRKAEGLRELGDGFGGGLAGLALAFSLAPRAVSAVIPGARTVEQLDANVAASGRATLAPEARDRIDRVRAGWGEAEGWC